MNKERKAEYDRKHYLENKDAIIKQQKEYVSKNKEKRAKYVKEYLLKNKEKLDAYDKNYREKNKGKCSMRVKNWMLKHPEKAKEYTLKYRLSHPDYIKQYRLKNKDKIVKSGKLYRLKNKEKLNSRLIKYNKFRRRTNGLVAIRERLRTRLRHALNHYSKTGKIRKSKKYGIDYEAIINHLKPFPEDLNKFQIDHIKPISSFDFNDLNQVKEAFAPKNHQWLTSEENQKKSNKLWSG